MTEPTTGDSTYVDVAHAPWQETRFPGIEIKILWQDDASEAYTALFKVAPGATLPLHRHTGVEQTFVLEGSLEDHEGSCTAGNYVWRKPGSVHAARSPNGCLAIGMFQSANEFLE